MPDGLHYGNGPLHAKVAWVLALAAYAQHSGRRGCGA